MFPPALASGGVQRGAPLWQEVWRTCLHTLSPGVDFQRAPPFTSRGFLEGRGPGGWSPLATSPEGCTPRGGPSSFTSLLGRGPGGWSSHDRIAGLQRAPTSGRGSRECPPASATHCHPPFPYAPQPATISHATRLIPPRQKRQAKARRHQTIYQNPDARHKIPHFSAIILKSFKDQTQTPESNQSLRH